jgi:hypothetical protein
MLRTTKTALPFILFQPLTSMRESWWSIAQGPARCFGAREGVGRARKMGFDLALGLYARGQLLQPWVGSGDGDGVWTAEQWQTLTEEDQRSSAWLYPYRHRPTSLSSLDEAMTEVELGYRFYVLGLAYARSPYAYHALGSAMAVRLDAYAQVRGVPNLQAGEDFYLLNKLAKLRPLKRRIGSPIELTTRVSHRVPFGTGQALASLLQAKETRKTFSSLTFDPRVFEGLRLFLLHLTGQSPLESGSTAPPLTKVRLEPLVEKAVRDSAAELLASMQGELATAPSNAHRLRRIHERWDALRTLQFVHSMTQEHFPKLPARAALQLAGWGEAAESLEAMRGRLAAAEQSLPTCIGVGSWAF